jgi:hypothetical protein
MRPRSPRRLETSPCSSRAMAEENKVETVETKVETVETEQPAPVEEIDYDKELKEAQEKADTNRLGYAVRQAKKEIERVEPDVQEDNSDDIAAKVIQKILPALQSATQSNLIESKLEELSGGNDSLKRSIKWHMENSVNPSLDFNERAEAAHAIANKKVIAKTLKEINLAQKTRANIVGIGEGSSTEVNAKPGDNVLSDNQVNDLKKIARQINLKPGKETDDFVANARKNLLNSRRPN